MEENFWTPDDWASKPLMPVLNIQWIPQIGDVVYVRPFSDLEKDENFTIGPHGSLRIIGTPYLFLESMRYFGGKISKITSIDGDLFGFEDTKPFFHPKMVQLLKQAPAITFEFVKSEDEFEEPTDDDHPF